MTNNEPTTSIKASGFLKVNQNGSEMFNATRINLGIHSSAIEIQGFVNVGFPEQRYFHLLIDSDTLGGEQEYVAGGKLNFVYYHREGQTIGADKGTFNANLDNVSRRYKLTFKLQFIGIGELDGEIDVTPLIA
jgi:hypothetical protein